MRRIGTLNPYPRPRERQGSGNRLLIRLGRQPRPCRHRSVRRQTDQLPVLRLGQTEERNQHIRKCSPTLPIAKPVLRPRDGAELQPIQVLFT